MSRVLRFADGAFAAAHDPMDVGESPALADSFLCLKGRVRGFSLHRQRFEHDLREVAPHLVDQLDAFYMAMAAELADEPEVFPRVDVHEGSLWLRVRPVPELTSSVRAVSQRDDSDDAHRKGPNISHYTALNAQHGCETIRLDAHGRVLEGVTSAVMWWADDSVARGSEPGQRLARVSDTDRVWSTTEDLVFAHARALNCATEHDATQETQPPDIQTLMSSEVWVVNALQGIRTVTSIDGHELPEPDVERLERFRTALDETWEPIAR